MTEHTSSISSVDAAFAALKAAGISEGTIEQGIKELVHQRDAVALKISELQPAGNLLAQELHAVTDPIEEDAAELLSACETWWDIQKTDVSGAIRTIEARGVEKFVDSRRPAWNGTTEAALKFAARLRNGEAE
ncbi:hypothetical protein BTJ39_24015 [Izhakiella australiensis]|uniref:Uncharacterized protein n=1 Tax=Izhakiella australiensis TaxID=1926881 RepID=A0A1S8Y3W5_9GAMM|nr:hypothetical protein [Izhakiella australiensis]OON33552.1 hypothetical protein BTJ39_24015 [Izhakiella australiensis]